MTASVKDYDDILDGLLADVERAGDAVSSVVLFGSMARGDVLPGHSDVMDVFMFLKPDLFGDKARFLETLEVMAEACEKIADRSPGPFHPFFYWSETDPIPATFALDITVHSKVVLGEDIRSRLHTTAPGRLVARTSFFEMRRLGLPLMAYLHKEELTEQDCQAIFNLLMAIKRDLPMLALMVLDIWVVQKESIPALRETFPDIDSDVLEKIVAIQHGQAERTAPHVLRATLREAMVFVESLNDRLVAYVNAEPKT
jgi:hypothetical protein